MSSSTTEAGDVDFNRDIRPILSDKCYACHGPDAEHREADLRFDEQASALGDLGGYSAIVPGDVEASTLVTRIMETDDDLRMPPPAETKQLTETEKQLLRQWIEQGAKWANHWAYEPPSREGSPSLGTTEQVGAGWGQNLIDQYVLAKLLEEGFTPSEQAEPRILFRRLSQDLIGLPPTPEELQEYLDSDESTRFESAVDRLLKSPHFGERMAIYWLDLVRYADTVGYHGDQDVSVSPFRDYVISAFNKNMPFDQFTREQLAGDLLENPTPDQLIASGYNKLGMMSAEGGVQPEEYLAKYAADRVRTAGTVWLGSTIGCAECHDHKFDPFSARDFYRFAAFFADIKERGLYSGANRDGNWGPYIEVPDVGLDILLEPIDQAIREAEAALKTAVDGAQAEQADWEAEWKIAADNTVSGKSYFSKELVDALKVDKAKRKPEQKDLLSAAFRDLASRFEAERRQLRELRKQREAVRKTHTRTTLITKAVEPREMRVLHRGDWMDKTGEIVEPGVPHFLKQLESEKRANRLDLANWIVSRDNPLTARVFVNRLWKLLFGTGLSKTVDDFGSQGENPSHPELLDALAIEFMESGWDVKHVIKLMVMSSTYRQSSMPKPVTDSKDPYNRLLARQSRFRLDAEMVRDNALAVSGLLVAKVGGRSVKPYQPAGLLRHLNFPKRTYQQDTGPDQYRRGVYTHWQRQFLHPAMQAFDAPAREECTAQRPRSNTPLAALVLLNDPSYVEAARRLAERALLEFEGTDAERIDWVWQQALNRDAFDGEQAAIIELLGSERAGYAQRSEDAKELVSVGLSVPDSKLDVVELASWTSVARAVLNLHETITRN
ncbi:MAG: DUF1553 domain-containing protein [Aureliella sp.]